MKNVLVLGSGAREHSICEKLTLSEEVREVFVFPGNDLMESENITKVNINNTFDDILAKLTAVNADTCSIMHVGDLKLPEDTVSHIPDIKEININPVFPNRTSLLHLHNMALNRAFYFSYILQSR